MTIISCVINERKIYGGVIQVIGEFCVSLTRGGLMVGLYKLLVNFLCL